jgi:hypothetical protein
MQFCHPQSFAKPVKHDELGYETPDPGGVLRTHSIAIQGKNLLCVPQNDVDRGSFGEWVNLIQTLTKFLSEVSILFGKEMASHLTTNIAL